jgi:hypothetical protein
VQFRGQVDWIEDLAERRRALELLVDHHEADPGPVKEREVTDQLVARTCVGRLRVLEMTGKRSPAPKKG